ncbi:MAG: hypothetical protein LAT81_09395, partial [Oceanicaulis sp.]|nr:hypothetical protein [Oceanicaulis sp.]
AAPTPLPLLIFRVILVSTMRINDSALKEDIMSAMPQRVSIAVSREGLLRSARDQFTSPLTFLSELMQNARRSGASRVEIQFDEQPNILSVADDGSGISDPSALLTLGKSGWDNLDALASENPYGVGFASAIFASERVKVESASWVLDADTADRLAFAPVVLQEAHPMIGTRITLHLRSDLLRGGQLYSHDVRGALERASQGFSIPVLLNGHEIERPHAADNLDGFDTPYGFVSYPFDPTDPVISLRGYLQGLPLQRFPLQIIGREKGIIHLDSSKFRARMPDRDQLIDGKAQLDAVQSIIAEKWREKIQGAKAALSPIEFSRLWTGAALSHGCPELLEDCPLTGHRWGIYVSPTGLDRWCGDASERALRTHFPSQQEPYSDVLQPCSQLIWMLDDMDFFEDVDEQSLVAAYAVALGWPAIEPNAVRTKGHWASCAVDLTSAGLRIASVENPRPGRSFAGHGVDFDVICCDSYTATAEDPSLPELVITNAPSFDPETGHLLVPAGGLEHLESMLLQVSSYEDEHDQFNETWLDDDLRDLRNIVNFGFNEDSAALLLALMQNALLSAGREHFRGQKFHVDFDTENGVPAITRTA